VWLPAALKLPGSRNVAMTPVPEAKRLNRTRRVQGSAFDIARS
jgi:hypothetical protein